LSYPIVVHESNGDKGKTLLPFFIADRSRSGISAENFMKFNRFGCSVQNWHEPIETWSKRRYNERGMKIYNLAEVLSIKKNETGMINEEIRDKEVRVIDADGTMLGVMSPKKALEIAVSKNLDLVKIAPNSVPPVCKIMDYGKYQYEKSKREKESKKKQTILNIKEVRLSAKIDKHDFDFKVKNAYRFLQNGDKVKVSIRFRGRELQFTQNGYEVLNAFADALKEVGVLEKKPNLDGKSMVMVMNPITTKNPPKN
jgi:translation initiation factor IF-3